MFSLLVRAPFETRPIMQRSISWLYTFRTKVSLSFNWKNNNSYCLCVLTVFEEFYREKVVLFFVFDFNLESHTLYFNKVKTLIYHSFRGIFSGPWPTHPARSSTIWREKYFPKKNIKKNKQKTEIFSFLHKKSKRSGKSLKTSLSNRFAINLHYHSPAARLNGWCRNIMAMLSFLMLVCPVQGYRGCDWSRSVVIFLWPWDRRFAFLGRGFRW